MFRARQRPARLAFPRRRSGGSLGPCFSLPPQGHRERSEGPASFSLYLPQIHPDRSFRSTVHLIDDTGAFFPIPFRIRTSTKHTHNPFRFRTSKTQDLKLFRIRTYGKTPGGRGRVQLSVGKTSVCLSFS